MTFNEIDDGIFTRKRKKMIVLYTVSRNLAGYTGLKIIMLDYQM